MLVQDADNFRHLTFDTGEALGCLPLEFHMKTFRF
jgi:hypothetical protein